MDALGSEFPFDKLSRSPLVLNAAVRWRGILAGRPWLAEERFGWTRTS